MNERLVFGAMSGEVFHFGGLGINQVNEGQICTMKR